MRPLKHKSSQVTDAIIAKVKLLHVILDKPKLFINDTTIRSALKSQGALAGLTYTFSAEDATWTTTPISLTTLKSKIFSATDSISFENLNRMRTGALEALVAAEERSTAPPPQTKLRLKENNESLEKALEIHKENNFHLLQALLFAKSALESLNNVQNEKARDRLIRESSKTIANILSLNSYPFNQLERLTYHMQTQLKAVK